ncbi:MAG: MYG1 family protein [Opitutae bacterium]
MPTIDTILTHPGGAHKDEFLACSVLLALHPVPIVRREPKPEDLASTSVCVVDVGHRHEPERNNFDHHQLPKDHPPTCSLSLVLQHLDLYEDARQFCDWLETAEWFDCRGLVTTAQWLGTEPAVVSKLISPIDVTLLRRFALAKRIEPGQPLWEVMRLIGEDLLDYVKTMRLRLDTIGQQAAIWDIGLDGQPAKILFLPRTDPLPDDPAMGVEQYITSRGWDAEIIGTVYPDRRSTGYGMSRHRDNPRLDFTRLAQCPDVHFTHARGFVAKTSAAEIGRLKELVTLAGHQIPST